MFRQALFIPHLVSEINIRPSWILLKCSRRRVNTLFEALFLNSWKWISRVIICTQILSKMANLSLHNSTHSRKSDSCQMCLGFIQSLDSTQDSLDMDSHHVVQTGHCKYAYCPHSHNMSPAGIKIIAWRRIGFYTPLFSTLRYIKEAYNHMPFPCPQQAPWEVVGAERVLNDQPKAPQQRGESNPALRIIVYHSELLHHAGW